MSVTRVFGSTALVLALMSATFAQPAPETTQPTKEHQLLQQFVGEWETSSEGVTAPGQPTITCTGTAKSRMIGGFWVVSELETDMMGTKIVALQTIGYDATKKKYIGTWVDSMFNHMWHYVGAVDASGKKLVLEAEGPNFMAGDKTTKYRDSYEFKSKDHIESTSSMLGEDGKWIDFMKGQFRRKT
jgi:hypothetical protein